MEQEIEDQEIIEKIWYLYFEEMYDYEHIIKYFKNKYSHWQIKKAINKRYEKTPMWQF